MSADNGIYIGKFPLVDGGYEYRVIEAQGIENCDYGDDRKIQDLTRVIYYKGSRVAVFYRENYAWKWARELAEDYSILEYGISLIEYDRPLLSISPEDANEELSHYDYETEKDTNK